MEAPLMVMPITPWMTSTYMTQTHAPLSRLAVVCFAPGCLEVPLRLGSSRKPAYLSYATETVTVALGQRLTDACIKTFG